MRDQIRRARVFRQNMTEPEVILWARLKKLRQYGYHFRRQAPFRGYYLDFVCFARRLVVEVDGGHHAEDIQAARDEVRDGVLRREGFTVLRYWASAVYRQTDTVMTGIMLALEAADPTRLAPPARSTLPMKGRE